MINRDNTSLIVTYDTDILDPIANELSDNNVVAVGDMHGNWINLYAITIENNFLEYPVGRENEFSETIWKLSFKNIDDYTAEDKLTIIKIIRAMVKVDLEIDKHLVLLGDLTADRCRFFCDLGTLTVLDKLREEQVFYNIIASNHGFEFIYALERFRAFNRPTKFLNDEKLCQSMRNLQKLIDKGFITIEEIQALYERAYKSRLILIGYSLNIPEKHCTIYAHTPVGLSLNSIIAVHDYLCDGLNKKDVSHITMIDEINAVVRRLLDMDKFHLLFMREDNEYNPLPQFILGRSYQNQLYPDNRYTLRFTASDTSKPMQIMKRAMILNDQIRRDGITFSLVHGHCHGKSGKPENVLTLDGQVGKCEQTEGERTIFETYATHINEANEVPVETTTSKPDAPIRERLLAPYQFVAHNAVLIDWLYVDGLIMEANKFLREAEGHKINIHNQFKDEIALLQDIKTIINAIPLGEKKFSYFMEGFASTVFKDKHTINVTINAIINALLECATRYLKLKLTCDELKFRHPAKLALIESIWTNFNEKIQCFFTLQRTLENLFPLPKKLLTLLTDAEMELDTLAKNMSKINPSQSGHFSHSPAIKDDDLKDLTNDRKNIMDY